MVHTVFYKGVALPFVVDTLGTPVDPEWANLIKQRWDRKYIYTQMKPIWKKYPIPEDLADSDSVLAPEMNSEILGLMEK